jgi:hypothetical protein
MTDSIDDPKLTKARIKACAMQAEMNANNHGGDSATAAADLLCAFVLISLKQGAKPDLAKDAMWEHAKAAVKVFFPKGALH